MSNRLRHINLFETIGQYEDTEKLYPNVAYIEETGSINVDKVKKTQMFYTSQSGNIIYVGGNWGGAEIESNTYEEGQGVVTFAGTPTYVPDFAFNYSELTSIELPSGITVIGNGCFQNCDYLTGVTIPDTVVSMGYDTFRNCYSLEEIYLPDSVTNITHGFTFAGCTSLKDVHLPVNLVSLTTRMFLNCSSLESIELPPNLNGLSDYSFEGCTSLKSIVIPDTNEWIWDCAFYQCSSLSAVTFGARCNYIKSYAFYGCTALGSLTLPASVGYIEEGAFSHCWLDTISVEEGNPSYVNGVNCNAIIGINNETLIAGCNNTVIPETVTGIHRYAMEYTSLSSVTIPVGVTWIGRFAFANNSYLTDFNYAGTMEQWGQIQIEDNWKDNSAFTVVHCSDGDIDV